MTDQSMIVRTEIIRTMDDAERAARAMAASGFFPDSRQAAQAVVKILAGQELGFGAFASMTGVYIIQGKPVLAANLMAAAVKRTNKYNYRVVELTETVCELAFLENGKESGVSRFTWDDAEKAGLTGKDNWRKFPRNMLFARALSNGQKWYAPDVFNGVTVYTPDELGATVDEDGAVSPGQPQATAILQDEDDAMTVEKAMSVTGSDGIRYGDLPTENLGHILNGIAKALKDKEGKLTPERKADLERKRDAAKLLIMTPRPAPAEWPVIDPEAADRRAGQPLD